MKTLRSSLEGGQFLILSLVVLACNAKVSAQTANSNLIPVVTVQATQRTATENYPGVFTVFRAGNTNLTLNVWYDLSGTASNGVDYAPIPLHSLTIPAGATSNTIVITPLTNPPPSSAAKTVLLTLTNSPLMTPINYEIGSPSQATVYLQSTNPAPVKIINPLEGMVFYTPTNILIAAFLNDVNSLTNVGFFAGTNDLGNGILNLGALGGFASFTWTNPPVGNYALTAVASYNDLAHTLTNPPVGYYAETSAPVNISLQPSPITNVPPTVNLIEPTNGAVFYVSTNAETYIEMLAKASDPDGSVTNVEFFAGMNDLGPGSPVVLDPPGVNGVTGLVYFIYWRSPSPGNYALTAVATDDGGASTTSAAVDVTIQPGPPPATNPPPVVRIISPADGSVFRAPINLPLFAYFTYPHVPSEYGSVGFYDGTNFLGVAHPVLMPQTALSTNIYELVWTNAPVGNHVLTAQAVVGSLLNALVLRIVSTPVNITILPSPPPPTNAPVVSIVATDPIAIEGTNCWVWPGETNSPPTWAAWPTAVCRWFTNCGPKIAIFTVRRFGNTNFNLTVPYDIGGTASNGVDYVALPGTVFVPAGERRAMIPVIPIDDGPPDVNKTIVLTLLPDMQMNPLPGYVLGFPRRAAAIILDPGPRPVSGSLVGRCFHFNESGPDAAWFCIEYSTNLVNWTPVCTNQVVDGSIDFVDPDAASNSSRFYRAVPLATPPAD